MNFVAADEGTYPRFSFVKYRVLRARVLTFAIASVGS